MPSPRFTIALPVRNGGAYLRLCVESILAQSCDDFELAVLDNASTDGTPDYLTGLRDPRVRLYPAERPLSITENWARILTIPKNEFLTTIGHDDLLDPEFLEVISGLIRAHPNASLYLTHFRLIDSQGGTIRYCQPMPTRETAAEFLAARFCDLRDSFGTGYVMRSADYDRVGGIPSYCRLLYADDSLMLKLMHGSYRATALESCCAYRLHLGSTSGSPRPLELVTALSDYWNFLVALAGEDPDVATILARYGQGYLQFHIGRCARSLLEERLLSGRSRNAEDDTTAQKINELLEKTHFDHRLLTPSQDHYWRRMQWADRSRARQVFWRWLERQRRNLRAVRKRVADRTGH